jgi:photosystem II stability/assembly factor-like uncharacterized protein
MNVRVVLLAAGLSGLAMVGCKKSAPGGGGGGGGGGWLVGTTGLMANVNGDGELGQGYHLDSTVSLNGIACRYTNEAWVVGDAGTVLYTDDGGSTWSTQTVPTNADLHALATQDSGPVYVAGNGTFLTSADTGSHWTQLTEQANFTSLAAADASTVLAISDDGGVWSYANSALTRIATVPGANAVAVSADGNTAVIAGNNGLAVSNNAGQTWQNVAVDAQLEDVDVTDDGAVAVGLEGAIVQYANGEVSLQHVGTTDLRTLHLADSGDALDVGFAGGDNGTVLVSDDAGASWTLGPNLGDRTILSIDQIGPGHR